MLSMVAVDINQDLRPDLVISSNASLALVVLRHQRGGLASQALVWGGSEPSAGIVGGDLDGDGRQDVALAAHRSNAVSVLRSLAH